MVPMITKSQKGLFQLRVKIKGNNAKFIFDLFYLCKKYWGKPCDNEFGACFGCEKHGHMIWDCP